MARVYTRQLAAGNDLVAGDHVLGVVPADRRWILRDLVISGVEGTQFNFYALTGRGFVSVWYVKASLIWQRQELRTALESGDQLHLQFTPGQVGFSVTLYDFSTV